MRACGWNDPIHGFLAGPGPWSGGLLHLVLLAAIMVLAAVLVPRLWSGGGRNQSALATLCDRYARGEIDDDEFRQKRRELKS